MGETVRIGEMPWTDYDARVRDGRRMVMLPIGALEQHGPHLPMNCDVVIPSGVAERVAKRIDALVAPAIAYGYKSQPKSGGGNHFPGTTSLDAMTLIHTVRDVIKEFARHGVRKVTAMVGHYENTMFTIEGIDLALRDLRADGIKDMKVVRLEYWDFISTETVAKVWTEGFPGWATEHAGVMETALMLRLHPELVDMSKVPTHPPASFPLYDVYPVNPAWVPADGALCSAKLATAEKGEIFLEELERDIAKALAGEFKLPEAGQSTARPAVGTARFYKSLHSRRES